jgi:cupin fold WbuC family metalloprotein
MMRFLEPDPMAAADPITRISEKLFEAVAQQASQSPRLRKNHNFHAESDLVQRFLNVLQPGTYVRPHRHCRQQPGSGFECFLVLQGAIGVLLFNEQGEVVRHERLEATGGLRGIQLQEGHYHSLLALAPDSVMFELKQGPYEPLKDKDFLMQFPLEGTPESMAQERQWRAIFSPAGAAQPPHH